MIIIALSIKTLVGKYTVVYVFLSIMFKFVKLKLALMFGESIVLQSVLRIMLWIVAAGATLL